jgi:hypothetical protein
MTDTSTESTDVPTRPATVNRAFWAAIAWAALSVLTAVDLLRHRSYVTDAIIRNAKSDKDKERINTPDKLDHIVSGQMTGGVISAIIIALMVVLLAFAFGRKQKNWARWVLAIVAVVPFFSILGIGILLHVVTALQSEPPVDYRILQGLAAVAALVMLVYLFMPATRDYFARLRPNRIGASGRPGGLFGGLFGNARQQVDESRRQRQEARAPRGSRRSGEAAATSDAAEASGRAGIEGKPDTSAGAESARAAVDAAERGAKPARSRRRDPARTEPAAPGPEAPDESPESASGAPVNRPRAAKPKRSTGSAPPGRPRR